MTTLDANLLGQLPLADIAKVTFYKRDEIISDLICCDVAVAGTVWTFNEEQLGWDLLLQHLYKAAELPNRLVCCRVPAAVRDERNGSI